MKPLDLNLATRPRRNRRLFLFLAGWLGLALVVVVVAATFLFVRFTLKKSVVRAGLRAAEETIRVADTEQKRLAVKIREAVRKDQKTIDSLNGIILRKSFAWTELLSKLEVALPSSCHILSLTPTQVEDVRIRVRFKVASPTLEELLSLIDKLDEMKFTEIRFENEERNNLGQLTSEISVTYERAL